jgi:hypothetical protein
VASNNVATIYSRYRSKLAGNAGFELWFGGKKLVQTKGKKKFKISETDLTDGSTITVVTVEKAHLAEEKFSMNFKFEVNFESFQLHLFIL